MPEGLDPNAEAAEAADQAAKENKWTDYTFRNEMDGRILDEESRDQKVDTYSIAWDAKNGTEPIIESSGSAPETPDTTADTEAAEAADQAAKENKWTDYTFRNEMDGRILDEESRDQKVDTYSIAWDAKNGTEPIIESSGSAPETPDLDNLESSKAA